MTLSDGRVVKGKFQCMDRLRNFILVDARTCSEAAAKNGSEESSSIDSFSGTCASCSPSGAPDDRLCFGLKMRRSTASTCARESERWNGLIA